MKLKPLEESINSALWDAEIGKDFLNRIPSIPLGVKCHSGINKLDSIKLKKLGLQENTQLSKEEAHWESSDKGYVSKTYEELKTQSIKKINDPI